MSFENFWDIIKTLTLLGILIKNFLFCFDEKFHIFRSLIKSFVYMSDVILCAYTCDNFVRRVKNFHVIFGAKYILLGIWCYFEIYIFSLCRGLIYLLKVGYIILVDPNETGFLIFETVFLFRTPTLPYV